MDDADYLDGETAKERIIDGYWFPNEERNKPEYLVNDQPQNPNQDTTDQLDILSYMTVDTIVASIDSEIARLQQARALLSGDATKKAVKTPARRKRKMSAAARKRIGDAQRKRWAKQRASK